MSNWQVGETRIIPRVLEPKAVRFNPDAPLFVALTSGMVLGGLAAHTIDEAKAEATARWSWDRGDRLLIRETGEDDAPHWPFERQAYDRLHVFAVQRSAPLRWEFDKGLTRSVPVYRYSLKHVCTIDLAVLA